MSRRSLGRIAFVASLLVASFGMAASAVAAKTSSDALADSPLSSGALNRAAALDPSPAPPALFGTSGQRRINALSVNNPAADATAQDTQSETTIAVLGNTIVGAWNDSGSFLGGAQHFTGFANSTNNGTSFTDRGVLPASAEGDAGDPVVSIDDAIGRVYLSTLGFNTGENIQMFRSNNGGASFGAPVNATPGFAGSGDFQDKEWNTVDNFAGAGNGNVYLCWTRFGAGGQEEILFTRSLNGGSSFGPVGGRLISNGGQGCYVAVGPSHDIYVFYYRGTGGGGQGGDNKLFMRRSTNQGVSFAPEVQVADLATTTVNGNLALNGGQRSNSFPHAAINPVSGDIVVVYNDDDVIGPADNGNIFYVRSLNDGATWSAPVKVNEDGPRDQFFPTVAINPNGNRIMFGYYSASHDTQNRVFHRRGRAGKMSTATGAITMHRSYQLGADTPVVIGQDPVINPTYMGDYDTIDSTNAAFHSMWADNRDGNAFHQHQPDVFYAQIATNSVVAATDIATNTTATPATISEGGSTTINVQVSATGQAARDVYVSVPPATGMSFQSATPAGCDVINNFVSCSLGTIAAGASKTVHINATGVTAGTRTVTGTATTSDKQANVANDKDSATVTINPTPGTTQTFSTGNIAVPINDLSTVDVPLNVGPAGNILDIDAIVRLNHTFDGDLNMFLIAPGGGTTVELSTANGGGGDNYGTGTNNCAGTPTTFDDLAANPITGGTPPFAGSFQPEGTLSDFAGLPENGQWKLRVTDAVGGDTGTIGCFKLKIKRP